MHPRFKITLSDTRIRLQHTTHPQFTINKHVGAPHVSSRQAQVKILAKPGGILGSKDRVIHCKHEESKQRNINSRNIYFKLRNWNKLNLLPAAKLKSIIKLVN